MDAEVLWRDRVGTYKLPFRKCCAAPLPAQVGLDPADAEVLCRLAPMLSKHLLSVTPIVAKV